MKKINNNSHNINDNSMNNVLTSLKQLNELKEENYDDIEIIYLYATEMNKSQCYKILKMNNLRWVKIYSCSSCVKLREKLKQKSFLNFDVNIKHKITNYGKQTYITTDKKKMALCGLKKCYHKLFEKGCNNCILKENKEFIEELFIDDVLDYQIGEDQLDNIKIIHLSFTTTEYLLVNTLNNLPINLKKLILYNDRLYGNNMIELSKKIKLPFDCQLQIINIHKSQTILL